MSEVIDLAQVRAAKAAQLEAAYRLRFLGGLIYLQRLHKYKPGWVGYTYKDRFGEWPPSLDVEPIVPSDEVTAFVEEKRAAWAEEQGIELKRSVGEAAADLLEILADGPKTARDGMKAMRDRGHADDPIGYAKAAVGIVIFKTETGTYSWRLPEVRHEAR